MSHTNQKFPRNQYRNKIEIFRSLGEVGRVRNECQETLVKTFTISGSRWNSLVVNEKYLFCHKLLLSRSCPTLGDSTDCSTPGLSGPHHPWSLEPSFMGISGAIQPSQPLTPSSPALDHSHHLLNISL